MEYGIRWNLTVFYVNGANQSDRRRIQMPPRQSSALRKRRVFLGTSLRDLGADFEFVKLASDFNLSESKMAKLLKAFKDPRTKSENITLKDRNHIKILMDKFSERERKAGRFAGGICYEPL
jgi:hypothetical protein